MKPCRCLPPVEDPRFRAYLATGGMGIYSPGHTVEEAIRNLARHAKRDRIPRRSWADAWVEDMRGKLVREDALADLLEVQP